MRNLLRKIASKISRSAKASIAILAITLMRMMIASAQVNIQPTAPTSANALTTVLGYLTWLGIVGGVGVGALLAGIKIGLMHDMEGGKRDLMYSVIGGVIISLISAILNLFI